MWHLLILSEDDATRQLGNGLALAADFLCLNQIQVCQCNNGWQKTVNSLKDKQLNQYTQRRILLIIDFDKCKNRLDLIRKDELVKTFQDRIFIIGSFSEAEDLKKCYDNTMSLEDIGKSLATDCSQWKNKCLNHCQNEVKRLCQDLSENVPSFTQK
jgi:hypothetical protein